MAFRGSIMHLRLIWMVHLGLTMTQKAVSARLLHRQTFKSCSYVDYNQWFSIMSGLKCLGKDREIEMFVLYPKLALDSVSNTK